MTLKPHITEQDYNKLKKRNKVLNKLVRVLNADVKKAEKQLKLTLDSAISSVYILLAMIIILLILLLVFIFI
jgi:uncharacterized FlaG/YvyC family protein